MTARPSIQPRWWWLPVVAVAIAALSLLGPHSPTYDPWAWLIWGREITHADLTTVYGPSWKPFPVVFTTIFALLGSTAAPLLWLVVARAAGLMALVLTYRLASRLAGRTAGVIAALALLLADTFLGFVWRGNSEGILVFLILWAILRHLDGHRRQVFAILAAAALLRPEIWPILGGYGLWLAWCERDTPRRWPTLALVVGTGAVVIVAWFLPEYLGSGDWTRAASRAREPVADSPGQADHPFLAVFTNSRTALAVPAYVGAVLAVLWAAWRLRGDRTDRTARVIVAIAALSAILMVEVAFLAQGGFTGNPRYVILAASLLCVLAGAGWVLAARELRARIPSAAFATVVVVVVAVSAVFASHAARTLNHTMDGVRAEARLAQAVQGAIDAAGGRAAVVDCGTVTAGPYQTQLVAWHLRLHEEQIHLDGRRPGSIVATTGSAVNRTPGFRVLARHGGWTVLTSCGA